MLSCKHKHLVTQLTQVPGVFQKGTREVTRFKGTLRFCTDCNKPVWELANGKIVDGEIVFLGKED